MRQASSSMVIGIVAGVVVCLSLSSYSCFCDCPRAASLTVQFDFYLSDYSVGNFLEDAMAYKITGDYCAGPARTSARSRQ